MTSQNIFLETHIIRQFDRAGQMRLEVVGGPQPLSPSGGDTRRVRQLVRQL